MSNTLCQLASILNESDFNDNVALPRVQALLATIKPIKGLADIMFPMSRSFVYEYRCSCRDEHQSIHTTYLAAVRNMIWMSMHRTLAHTLCWAGNDDDAFSTHVHDHLSSILDFVVFSLSMGNLTAFRALLLMMFNGERRGRFLNGTAFGSVSVLWEAVRCNSPEAVSLLLHLKGIRCDQSGINGRSVLLVWAAHYASAEVIRLLRKHRPMLRGQACRNKIPTEEHSAICVALRRGDPKVIDALTEFDGVSFDDYCQSDLHSGYPTAHCLALHCVQGRLENSHQALQSLLARGYRGFALPCAQTIRTTRRILPADRQSARNHKTALIAELVPLPVTIPLAFDILVSAIHCSNIKLARFALAYADSECFITREARLVIGHELFTAAFYNTLRSSESYSLLCTLLDSGVALLEHHSCDPLGPCPSLKPFLVMPTIGLPMTSTQVAQLCTVCRERNHLVFRAPSLIQLGTRLINQNRQLYAVQDGIGLSEEVEELILVANNREKRLAELARAIIE